MFALTFDKETSYNFLEKFLKDKIKLWMYPQRRATLQYIIHMKKKVYALHVKSIYLTLVFQCNE